MDDIILPEHSPKQVTVSQTVSAGSVSSSVSVTALPGQVSKLLDIALEKAAESAEVVPDKKGSLVLDVNLKGASVEVGHKIANNWLAGGYAGVDFGSGKKEAGFRIKGAW